MVDTSPFHQCGCGRARRTHASHAPPRAQEAQEWALIQPTHQPAVSGRNDATKSRMPTPLLTEKRSSVYELKSRGPGSDTYADTPQRTVQCGTSTPRMHPSRAPR